MKLKEIKQEFHNALGAYYTKEEIDQFFYTIQEVYFDVRRIDLALQPDMVVQKPELALTALEQLKQGRPIQYILGHTEFFGLSFKVNDSVLIPRPETEELVSWILGGYKKEAPLRILDIGTGSGCIAIALAKHFPEATVVALDVSKAALEVARENAKINGVLVAFVTADILHFNTEDVILELENFDVIVSNPPYVRTLEKQDMRPNVLDFEPHLALFVSDNNPLVFYKAIANFGKTMLKKNGQLFFEINEYLGKETATMLEMNNYKAVELKQDIFGKDRMVKAIQKN